MSVIPFPTRTTKPEPLGVNKLNREAELENILDLVNTQPLLVILFIDGQKMCLDYIHQNPWIKQLAATFELDQETIDHFQIMKIPQWRWYLNGTEVHHLIGTALNEEVQENHQIFLALVVVRGLS